MEAKENKRYYKTIYKSAIGNITLACNEEENLVGLWIEGQKYFGDTVNAQMIENNDLAIFKKAKNG